jgi:hypothetical protein
MFTIKKVVILDLRLLYKNQLLKLMSFLVFIDSFILLFLGIGIKNSQGITDGLIFGVIGGFFALFIFNILSGVFIATLSLKGLKH